VRGLALPDTALEQRVIFVFFHFLSLHWSNDLSLLLAPRTQVALLSNAGCCARAASGQAAAAPPSVAKNFRRPMWLAM
jgi:hypothetical protein